MCQGSNKLPLSSLTIGDGHQPNNRGLPIGFPAPKPQQEAPQPGNTQQFMQALAPQTAVPQQMMPQQPMNSIPEDGMEVGRTKRGLDASDDSMHDGEIHGWDLVHEEVMAQLTNNGLVGQAFQRDAPPQDPNLWRGVDYEHCNPDTYYNPIIRIPTKGGMSLSPI